MKRLFAAALALLLSVAEMVPAHATAPPARMDQVARFYVDQQQFMGTVLVARGEQVLFAKAYGSANLEWNVPNTTDTRFRIGSVSKQFTAAAILLLEERGKLKLGDRVKKHYADAPQAWDAITIEHLLNHTSGIPNFTSFPDYERTEPLPTTVDDLIKRFRDKPLEFTPGARMSYSNSGYALLGLVIEKASGTSYARFLDDTIFKPLGLKDTGYEPQTALLPRRAAGYRHGRKGMENANYLSMSVPYSAGALYSTVHDLHRWNLALYGHKLLSAASLEKMITPAHNDYALGLVVTRNHGKRVYQHGGGISGFNSALAYYPDNRVTVAVLCNVNGPGADGVAGKLNDLALGHGVTLPTERKTVAVPRTLLEKYAGSYTLRPGTDLAFTIEGDHLAAQGPNQPKLPLRAESQNTFFALALEAEVQFQTDASGKVTGARLRQNGRDTLMPRVADAPTQ